MRKHGRHRLGMGRADGFEVRAWGLNLRGWIDEVEFELAGKWRGWMDLRRVLGV